MFKKVITIDGMKCDGCAKTIKEKFNHLASVKEVKTDLDKKEVTIISEVEISTNELKNALKDTKYKVIDK
ncbi:heavy metal-associated domain-containing protein [Melissococcus plutonius]|uniref:Copper chaperone n=2 Tax=Melissococcus plutonius TaxID=33970 RepID=F3YCH9_MELPT|nr:heavy metal-associated domain-containing protein [Melissococcus plutonius]BAL61563.1 copper chaperone [Melissococcus plutonius DAT561]AIM26003.1 copper chaperone [Melissococcus plutonius S1]KMT23769.1 copper chaperone [Melissococcus plutonius]KMT24129.1 copper chaperone [Melissococcus plutonius]KMT24529.1 copper chaperone [Melissococcus plutonius]